MFYHTHVFYSKKKDKSPDALKIVGSILPDLALTSAITWDDLHKKKDILKFFDFVKRQEPSFSSLLTGISHHNTLDYFTHIKYKNITPGFVYASITPQLEKLAKEAFNISNDRSKASAHNLIEGSVEYYILYDNPDLQILLRDSVKNIDKEKLSFLLSKHFRTSKQKVLKGLEKFFYFATCYDLGKQNEWMDFFEDLNKYYLNVDIYRAQTKEAFDLALDITKDTYKDFLKYAVSSKDTKIKDSN